MSETGQVNTNLSDVENSDQNTQGLAEQIESGRVEGFSADELNKRLLEESKLNKRKALDYHRELLTLRKEKEETTKTNLEANNQYKEAYELANQELGTLRKERVTNSLFKAVNEHAAREGCVSVEDLMKVADTSLLQLDDTTGEVHGVELMMEKAKREKAWLFNSQKTTSINPSIPRGLDSPKQGVTDRSKLTKEQILDQLKGLGQ